MTIRKGDYAAIDLGNMKVAANLSAATRQRFPQADRFAFEVKSYGREMTCIAYHGDVRLGSVDQVIQGK